jgi:hypothetical protein
MKAIELTAFAALMGVYLLACDYAGSGLPWANALRLVKAMVMKLLPS